MIKKVVDWAIKILEYKRIFLLLGNNTCVDRFPSLI